MVPIIIATCVTALVAYLGFVVVRLGLDRRLPLALSHVALQEISDRAARAYGDRPLFTCDTPPEWMVPPLADRYPDGVTWTANCVRSTAGYVAAMLRDLGVGHGDRVAILKTNHFDIHLLTLSVIRCGGIA